MQTTAQVPSTTTTPLVAHRVVDDDDGAAAGALPLLAESPNTAPGPAPLVHLHPAGKATGSPAEEGDVEEGDVEYAVTGAEDHALRMGATVGPHAGLCAGDCCVFFSYSV